MLEYTPGGYCSGWMSALRLPEVRTMSHPTPARPASTLVPLLVIATAQLMLVLDDSIVNIALPSIQQELNVAAVHLPWVVNAYILAFGALLLLGGRIGDLRGRLARSRGWRSSGGTPVPRGPHDL